MKPDLRPGDVLDIKGLKLELGKGPNRSSLLSSRSRDVALYKYTQLLLVPASIAFLPAAPPLAAANASNPLNGAVPMEPAPKPAAAIPPNTLEVCEPPGCAVDLPVASNELAGHSPTSIAIHPLGYTPRSHKVVGNFEDEEALAWLGPQELLFAFNPHPLIRRAGPSKSDAPVRMIRAVLLDAQTRNIVRAVDWELADSRQYLWQLDRSRILVHVGNELRVYRAGSDIERPLFPSRARWPSCASRPTES